MWRHVLILTFLALTYCNGELFGPGNQYIIEGKNLKFQCRSHFSSSANPPSIEVSSPNSVFDITKTSETKVDSILYVDVEVLNLMKNQSGKKIECKYDGDTHQLTVYVIPESDVPVVLMSNDMTTILAEIDSQFTLNCTETKLDKPVISWYQGGCFIKTDMSGKNVNIYKVDKVSWKDGGIYTCKAESRKWLNVTVVSSSKNYKVNVTLAKVQTAHKVEEVIAKKGENAELLCAIVGYPADITWKKGTSVLAKHEAVHNVSRLPPTCNVQQVGDDYSVSTDGKTLIILNADFDDRGQYLCIGESEKNKVEHEFILRIRDPLGAFWPFLGIVIEAIVLALIIFLSEARRKSKKGKESGGKVEFSTSSSDGGSKDEKVRLRTSR